MLATNTDNINIRRLDFNEVVPILETLLNFSNIRRNVDDFFLYSQNIKDVAIEVRQHSAVIYGAFSGEESVGCLLGFQRNDRIYSHFLFRCYQGVDVSKLSYQIIPMMITFYDDLGICINEVVGQIPMWNKSAMRVCQRMGSIDCGISKEQFHEDGKLIPCKEWVYKVPSYLHSIKNI